MCKNDPLFVTSKILNGGLAESSPYYNYTSYCLWPIFTCLILILGTVGAILITIK